jgi:hypothetical protein
VDAVRLRLTLALALIAIGGAVGPTPPGAGPRPERPTDFDPPEVILDGSEYGQLYPAFADIDGDGKIDLLVGVAARSGGGRLLVYRNRGTNARPVYEKPKWLDDTVPSARTSDKG